MLNNLIQSIRTDIRSWKTDRKTLSSLKRYGSNNHCSEEFYSYWQKCKRDAPVAIKHTPTINKAIRLFNEHGVTAWSTDKCRDVAEHIYGRLLEKEKVGLKCWDDNLRYKEDVLQAFPELEDIFHDSVSEFLCRVYGTHFKLYYGLLYKSVGGEAPPIGSELWHRDGGPGTCINVMFGISPLSKSNGALSCISQKHTLEMTKEALSHVRKRNGLQRWSPR